MSSPPASQFSSTRLAQIALVTLLLVGCVAVLWPFIGAVLFALVLWICTWPFYFQRIRPLVGGRDTLGATLMTLMLVLILLVPMIFFSATVVDGADAVIDRVRPYVEQGLPADPPAFLSQLPLIGPEIDATWHRIAGNREEMNKLLRQFVDPVRRIALSVGGLAANGLLQLVLVLFVAFFLYRDGEAIARRLRTGARKLGGDLGERMLDLARGTVNGVMLGLVGTAAAQAAVALVGFLIAGLPTAMLLALATFFLSFVPGGPVLAWGGAAFWLYETGQTPWAIFMVLYGALVISSIDNFVKPVLIARGAGISILLIALGVLGGVFVFGFIGIFLGPVLLALGSTLVALWTNEKPPLQAPVETPIDAPTSKNP